MYVYILYIYTNKIFLSKDFSQRLFPVTCTTGSCFNQATKASSAVITCIVLKCKKDEYKH